MWKKSLSNHQSEERRLMKLALDLELIEEEQESSGARLRRGAFNLITQMAGPVFTQKRVENFIHWLLHLYRSCHS